MIMLPPYDQDDQYPIWDLLVAMAGAEYRLVYTYRQRQDRWYLDVYDADGEVLLRAKRIVHGVPYLGGILCVDTLGEDPPGYEDLGRRHRMLLLEAEDLPAAEDDYDITIEAVP
jgi:hypothetical protein